MERFTLYASALDKALWAGRFREGGKVLAGYIVAGRPLVLPGLQSIDVSAAGSLGLKNLNHDVFASNPVMMEDIRQLLRTGRRPPDQRLAVLRPQPSPEQPEFWRYEPD